MVVKYTLQCEYVSMKFSELKHKLGQRIAWLRREKGMSQEDFAEASGKIVNTVSKIERGITDPKVSSLAAFAKALNTDIANLFADPKSYPVVFNSPMEKLYKLLQDENEETINAIIKQAEILLSVRKDGN